MGQLGFFDADKRLASLSDKGDPLEAIDRLVPWESFRADIEAVALIARSRSWRRVWLSCPDRGRSASANWVRR